jgi:hypothetical protein
MRMQLSVNLTLGMKQLANLVRGRLRGVNLTPTGPGPCTLQRRRPEAGPTRFATTQLARSSLAGRVIQSETQIKNYVLRVTPQLEYFTIRESHQLNLVAGSLTRMKSRRKETTQPPERRRT